MNTVQSVHTYDDLTALELHEARTDDDREYGRVAMAMPFTEGTIAYTIYRPLEWCRDTHRTATRSCSNL